MEFAKGEGTSTINTTQSCNSAPVSLVALMATHRSMGGRGGGGIMRNIQGPLPVWMGGWAAKQMTRQSTAKGERWSAGEAISRSPRNQPPFEARRSDSVPQAPIAPPNSGPAPPPPPPERTLGYVTCALAADSTKRRKDMGSSVAYKTIGTFLSQNMGHEDACGWATEMQSSGCAAVRQWPTLSFTHRTCKSDLDSEFMR